MSDKKAKQANQAQENFDEFDASVKELSKDIKAPAKRLEEEPQTKLSQRDIDRSKDIYLKPTRTVSCPPNQKFNEKFREKYEFDKEYVQFIAEHKEIQGETIDIWTRPYGGMAAEYWQVPTNKPVWGPRYLAEQIKNCNYKRLTIQQSTVTGADNMGQYFGQLVVDSTVQRLDAIPVNSGRKSIFMGPNTF